MIRLFVYLKGFASGALGMLCGYLLGWCVVAMLHAVPFLRIGRFEVRGNIPGMVFGIVIAILCARSAMRSEIKRQREKANQDGSDTSKRAS